MTYVQKFDRASITFCLFDAVSNAVIETAVIKGDFSQFAKGVENTNDFRQNSNAVNADQIEEWNYPVPSYQGRQGKLEKELIRLYGPFKDKK